ncbi:MAG: GNAT family N-acetyltransferase [Gammaproteobacteria bacterium]|nr:GNAT family N-acetyltransferase [Gammaproteobacteria bacterium]
MFEIRDYHRDDALQLDALAVRAIEQHQAIYHELPEGADKMKHYSSLSDSMQIVVATKQQRIVGTVGYVPANMERTGIFSTRTPIVRMLVVDPEQLGSGVDKALAKECMCRALREGCDSIALHISSMMSVSTRIARRTGMEFDEAANDDETEGVEYAIYQLPLTAVGDQ